MSPLNCYHNNLLYKTPLAYSLTLFHCQKEGLLGPINHQDGGVAFMACIVVPQTTDTHQVKHPISNYVGYGDSFNAKFTTLDRAHDHHYFTKATRILNDAIP